MRHIQRRSNPTCQGWCVRGTETGQAVQAPHLHVSLLGPVPPRRAGFPWAAASPIDQHHTTTTHSKRSKPATSKQGSIQYDAIEAWEDLIFLFKDFVPCYKRDGREWPNGVAEELPMNPMSGKQVPASFPCSL